jgi:hypothetical protein
MSTLTAKDLLLNHLEYTFQKEAWQPALAMTVQGLTAAQASWKPGPDRHSIWQIVPRIGRPMFERSRKSRRPSGSARRLWISRVCSSRFPVKNGVRRCSAFSAWRLTISITPDRFDISAHSKGPDRFTTGWCC